MCSLDLASRDGETCQSLYLERRYVNGLSRLLTDYEISMKNNMTEKELLKRLRPLIRYTDYYLQSATKRELIEACEARKLPVTKEEESLIALMTAILLPQAIHKTSIARTDQILELLCHRHPEMKKELAQIPTVLSEDPASYIYSNWKPGSFEYEEDRKSYAQINEE